MLMVNLAEFKTHCSKYIKRAQKGEEIDICIRNIPVAKLEPIETERKNKTTLGWAKGSGWLSSDFDPGEPGISVEHWEMLKDKPDDPIDP